MSLKIEALFNVAGKIAVVTGGSSGVGRMIAAAFAANGARVYIVGRKAEALEQAAAELSIEGDCIAVPGDLSLPDEPARIAAIIGARETGIHILVNNAGATWGASFETFPAQAWDKVFNVNVRGPFLMTQAFLPLLAALASDHDYGRVINISSVGARMIGDSPSAAYGPSKAAVEQLSRVMARLLGEHRVTVNCIAPGWFPSKMNAPLGEGAREEWIGATPVSRLGTAADMGGLVIFLCSPAGTYVDGQVIDLDGGRSL